ncbi:MAG: TPM domain-containing protein, partial [Candidatus Poseidoniaceae archaeon]|nr:TPM domain-containing protein [Candidatus Poseidoniaceae archaeon]
MKELNSSIRIIIVSSLILALILPNAASSEIVFPTDTNKFVIDEANVLSQADEDLLSEELIWLAGNDGWGTEIVVVIIESTAQYELNDETSNNTSNETSNNTSNETSNNTSNETSNNTSNE